MKFIGFFFTAALRYEKGKTMREEREGEERCGM